MLFRSKDKEVFIVIGDSKVKNFFWQRGRRNPYIHIERCSVVNFVKTYDRRHIQRHTKFKTWYNTNF